MGQDKQVKKDSPLDEQSNIYTHIHLQISFFLYQNFILEK